MLEQLDVRPGHRVLEIGAGTGFNAALLAHLVGDSGEVTTIEIDQDVADAATANLRAAGFPQVRVHCGDGGLGVPAHAPYDRVIVTAGTPELPAAWLDQIQPDGRVVAPLILKCAQRAIAFHRRENGSRTYWSSDSIVICGFIQIRGSSGGAFRRIPIGARAFLDVDGELSIEPDEIGEALTLQAYERPTGVFIEPNQSYNGSELWLPLTQPDACRLAAPSEAVQDGVVVRPLVDWGTECMSIALARGGSLAYLQRAPHDPESAAKKTYGIDVSGHGPDGPALADRLAAALREWDECGRPATSRLQVDVHPAGTPDQVLGTPFVLDRPQSRIAISWR